MQSHSSRFYRLLMAIVWSFSIMSAQPPRLALAQYDGCTAVPDYYFKEVCNIHDECYDTARLSREDCDHEFLDSMESACASRPDASACEFVAGIYYLGVRLFSACSYKDNPECQSDGSNHTTVNIPDSERLYGPCGESGWYCDPNYRLLYWILRFDSGTGCREEWQGYGGC
jgi:hypothetical protein